MRERRGGRDIRGPPQPTSTLSPEAAGVSRAAARVEAPSEVGDHRRRSPAPRRHCARVPGHWRATHRARPRWRTATPTPLGHAMIPTAIRRARACRRGTSPTRARPVWIRRVREPRRSLSRVSTVERRGSRRSVVARESRSWRMGYSCNLLRDIEPKKGGSRARRVHVCQPGE